MNQITKHTITNKITSPYHRIDRKLVSTAGIVQFKLNLVEILTAGQVCSMTVGRKEEKNLKAKQKKLLASQMDKQYSPSGVSCRENRMLPFSIYATETFGIHSPEISQNIYSVSLIVM
jgi:hypothetical protein